MKREQLLNKTIDILAKAYLQGILIPQSPCACAVGNLCASAMGYDIIAEGPELEDINWYNDQGGEEFPMWGDVFLNGLPQGGERGYRYHRRAKSQIDATGYSWLELMKIEKAFMNTTRTERQWTDKDQDEINFAGLMAVLDVLFEIHEVDEEDHQQYRKAFSPNSKVPA